MENVFSSANVTLPVIYEVEKDELGECLAVIHQSFKTVADSMGLTRENCPKHTHAKDAVKSLGGKTIKIGIIEESAVLKEWYIANGFIHTGTKKFDHLPFTSGYLERSV